MAKKAYSLGASFEWCVVKFAALGRDCRVLVIFNAAKQKYEAILGIMAADQLSVVCTYEYHATEAGWHCHAVCEDIRTAPRGCMRGPWVTRIPRARSLHTSMEFGIKSKTDAKRFAFDCYKIAEPGTLI